MASITSPSAGIVIYSYKDRGGYDSISDRTADAIVVTKSIISISTNKSKSRPSGSFDIRLAPSKNWTAIISPGSWVEIHMSPYMMTEKNLTDSGSSNAKTLKMIGVIDSVRLTVSVDQSTGARNTIYSLRGRDWGAALESFLYIDSAAASQKDNPLVNAVTLMSNTQFDAKDVGLLGIFTPEKMANKLIQAWGNNMAFAASNVLNRNQEKARYVLPEGLFQKLNSQSKYVSDNIKVIAGTLSGPDTYTSSNDSVGVLNPQSLVGTNTVWQLLHAHSNNVLNEMVAELRWEKQTGKPVMALYQRIKPFWVRSGESRPDYISSFFNVKTNTVSKNDVIAIDVGDNAEDVVNFIEILPDYSVSSLPSSEKLGLVALAKSESSVTDVASLSRFGLKPLMYSTAFAPIGGGGTLNWAAVKSWIPIVKEWYFDSHKMLNGTMTVVGQNSYVGVGDNILIDSSVLGSTSFVNGSDTKLVAHVESVSHSFRYTDNGSRTFITNISFIRGVIADKTGTRLVNDSALGIETKTNALPDAKKNIKNTYTE
jgi:hypothetical protein